MFSYSGIGNHSQVFRPFDLSSSQRPLNSSAFQYDEGYSRYASYDQSNDLYAL